MSGFDTSKTLTVRFVGDTSRLNKSFSTAYREAQGFGAKMGVVGKQLQGMVGPALITAGAAAGAFAIKLGIDGVQAAAAEDKQLAILKQTLDNVGQGFAMDEVNQFVDNLRFATGISDDQLRPSLESLIRVTKDAASAQDLLTASADASVATGKDLGTVSAAVAKAVGGQSTALKRLIPGLDVTKIKAGDTASVIAALEDRFGGSAAAAAKTFSGELARLQDGFNELTESFGHGFLNALGDGTQSMDNMAQALLDLQPAAQSLGNSIGTITESIAANSGIVGYYTRAIQMNIDLFKGFVRPFNWVLSSLGVTADAAGQSIDASLDRTRLYDAASDSAAKSIAAMNRQAANAGPVIFKLGDSAAVSTDKFDLLRAEMNRTVGTLNILAGAFDTANAAMAQRQAMQDYRDALKAFVQDPNEATRDAAVKANMDWAQSFKDPQKQAQITAQGYNEITAAAQDAGVKVPGWMKAMGDAAAAQQDPVAKLKQLMEEIPTNIQSQIAMHVTLNGKYYDPYGAYDSSTKKPATGGPFATGGYVRAALGTHASDNIPAMLSRGEYVLNADTVKRLGVGTLNGLNNGGAMGGSGVMIQTLNVQSVAGERAEESVPRALRRLAFVAGLNG